MKGIIKMIPVYLLIILLIFSPLFDSFNISSMNTYLAANETNYIEIESEDDLKLIEEDLSGQFIITEELDINEFDTWKPMGSEQRPFTGTLLANQKIINMDIKYAQETSKGLFNAMTKDATLDVEVEFLKVEEDTGSPETEEEITSEEEVESEEEITSEEEVESEEEITSEEEVESEGEIALEEDTESEEIAASEKETESEEIIATEELKSEGSLVSEEVQSENKKSKAQITGVSPRYLENWEVERTAPPLPSGFDTVSFDEVFHKPIGKGTEFLSDRELQITPDEKSQMGAVWSKDKLDFTKKFTIDSYLYLGNRGRAAADGLTITFQNDSRMKSNINQVIGDEGMGIGAYSADLRANGNVYIRNALSVEVDTYLNQGSRDKIDREITNIGSGRGHNGHIAVVIPAKDNNQYSGQHSNVINATSPISNGEWHKMTVKWDPASSGLTYQFDDYDAETYYIDNLEETFGGKEAHWGFTGSTGGSHALNVVAFKELPQHQLISQRARVKNMTEDGVYKDEVDVSNGQTLNYEVITRYDSVDLDPWKDGIVTVEIPRGFKYKEGSAKSDGQVITDGVVFDENTNELSFPKTTLDERQRENKLSFDLEAKTAVIGKETIKVRGEAAIKNVIGNDVTLNVKKAKEGFVKVHYINDATQKEIRPPRTFTGFHNETYNINPESISGYVLKEDKLPSNQTGTYIAGETIDVKFYYREGSLYISEVPDQINFKGKISSVDETYFFNKSEMNDSLIVIDEREKGADWSIDLKIKEDLTGKKTSRLLKNALHYRTEEGEDVLLNKEFQTIIEIENIDIGGGIKLKRYNLSEHWAEGKEGLYLKVAGSSVLKDEYKGELSWSLTDAP